jgi:hypothetical protein
MVMKQWVVWVQLGLKHCQCMPLSEQSQHQVAEVVEVLQGMVVVDECVEHDEGVFSTNAGSSQGTVVCGLAYWE